MNINTSQLKRLGKDTKAVQYSHMMDFPIKVLQIGEGIFFRASLIG